MQAALCGEMGGKPLSALALAAIGFRSLSMAPARIGPVKAMLRALDIRAARDLMEEALASDITATRLRDTLLDFAEAHGVPL